MNIKIRLKNPVFWVSIVLAILTPILAYTGITAADITTWAALIDVLKTAVLNPYVLALVVVSVYNALVDPTTTGVTDSKNAMDYDTPNGIK